MAGSWAILSVFGTDIFLYVFLLSFDYILALNLSALESEPAERAALSERKPPDRQRGKGGGGGAYSKDAVISHQRIACVAFKERVREH